MKLLESMFRLILQMWPADEAKKARAAVIKAYEERKSEMKATFIQPLHYEYVLGKAAGRLYDE